MPADQRYAAFLSYSHHDAAWARWLHKRLETYRVPRRMVGSAGEFGAVPARLRPVFRDREDLASSGDLGERIRAALASSDAMVVICSPAARQSTWVNQEIHSFVQQHGMSRVHALIVAGEPAAGSPDDCIPDALRHGPDAAGAMAWETIAADARPDRDGRSLARDKLLAGLLGVRLDALRQREYQRQQRRWLAIVAAALAGMALTGYLAYTATIARDDAERRRAQGEGLVDFMLTDLKGELESVQRLDALDAVGGKVIEHLRALPARDLNEATLTRRAQALRQIGEVHVRRTQHDEALLAFAEALRMDEELLARAPQDRQRVFNVAQSQFWVGNVYNETGRHTEALQAFGSYMRHAQAFLATDPQDPAAVMEVGYAHANLAAVHRTLREMPAALEHAQHSVQFMQQAIQAAPAEDLYRSELSNALAWLVDVQEVAGQLEAAATTAAQAVAVARELQASHPEDMRLAESLALRVRGEGNALRGWGRSRDAIERLREAQQRLLALTRHDPSNDKWLRVHRATVLDLVRAHLEALDLGAVSVDEIAILEILSAQRGSDGKAASLDSLRALAILGYMDAIGAAPQRGHERLAQALTGLHALAAQAGADDGPLLALAETALLQHHAGGAVNRAGLTSIPTLIERLAPTTDHTVPNRRTRALTRLWLADGQSERAEPALTSLLAAGFAEPRLLHECRRNPACRKVRR